MLRFFQVAGELYAVAFVIGFMLVMVILKSNSRVRVQEDFDEFQRREARKLEDRV